MQSHIPGIMAAPNSSRIKTRILRAEKSEQYADKWQLEFEILESENISGPNFARVGEKGEGFTFRPAWDLPLPVIVEAEAEYIGGPQKGLFQLTNLHLCK